MSWYSSSGGLANGAMTRCKLTKLLNRRVCKSILATPDRYESRFLCGKTPSQEPPPTSTKSSCKPKESQNNFLLQSPVSIHINMMLFDWLQRLPLFPLCFACGDTWQKTLGVRSNTMWAPTPKVQAEGPKVKISQRRKAAPWVITINRPSTQHVASI